MPSGAGMPATKRPKAFGRQGPDLRLDRVPALRRRAARPGRRGGLARAARRADSRAVVATVAQKAGAEAGELAR